MRHFGLIPREVRREPIRFEREPFIGISIVFALLPVILIIITSVVVFFTRPAPARDLGQWAQLDLEPGETVEQRAARSAWFNRQKMPDHNSSCCGEADAYYADGVWVSPETKDVFAVITDERPDAPLSRPHIKPGTRILIPPNKFKDTSADPNPTGHTIIFVRWYAEGDGGNWGVLCYLPDGSF